MISKDDLLKRIKTLERVVYGYRIFSEKYIINHDAPGLVKGETLSVPVVNRDGEYVLGFNATYKRQDISFEDVCKALQDMCGIEITYQEIEGSERVVIYEKDSD